MLILSLASADPWQISACLPLQCENHVKPLLISFVFAL